MTNPARCAFLDAPTPLAFAHRGGAAYGDENTLAAFARAVEMGYRYVETDTHATADGVAVVFHDAILTRMLGRDEHVARLRWADLASVRVGGQIAVPKLADVLDAFRGVRFNIDVKSDVAAAPTVAAVTAVGACDRVLLASFSDARLRRMRQLAGPGVVTSLATGEAAKLWLASRTGLPTAPPVGAVAAQLPVRHGVRVVDRRLIGYAHRLGLQVHVWTVDDAAEMADLLDLGVDGIMTDRIDVLRDVYTARGLWAA
ncbi:MAG TPA: glycerophosphodiester phosphodiesterase family protein [Micromonosporaceae bacterium]